MGPEARFIEESYFFKNVSGQQTFGLKRFEYYILTEQYILVEL